MVGDVVRTTAMARGAGPCIWTIVEIMGMKEDDIVMESIMKIEKTDTIVFLLIQEFDKFVFFFAAKGQIVNSLSFVSQTVFVTTAPLYKATMDKST